ncbi:MAG: WecB/TagA/CpsF family glycosyltransferase [Patescibacteria group bacterium]|mgnify:FL=1
MQKLDVAGLKIDVISKSELLRLMESRTKTPKQTWVTTVYSEFLYAALREPKTMKMLNQADIAIPDGIGIFWAQKFLEMPFTAKNYWLKIIEAYWQAIASLFSLPFVRRSKGEGPLKDRIPGSELIWDIAEMTAKNNLSIYLLGGFGNTPEIVSQKLSSFMSAHMPADISTNVKTTVSPKLDGRHKTGIVGVSNKNPEDFSTVYDIQNKEPNILLVAYGPIKQEKWILENQDKLPSVKLFMGVGGTFDYIAGKRLAPPALVRKIGLEWLWRLFTQPHRIKRIWKATFGLISALIKYKVFESLPLRQNVVSVILNDKNQILVCKHSVNNPEDKLFGFNRSDIIDHWQFPQGGQDGNEELAQTGIKECQEEVGLTKIKFIASSQKTHSYHYFNARRPFLGQFARQRGQHQHIVYFRHLGADIDVKVDNIEFQDYKWVDLSNLEKTLHEFRKPLAKIVMEDLKEMAEKDILKTN